MFRRVALIRPSTMGASIAVSCGVTATTNSSAASSHFTAARECGFTATTNSTVRGSLIGSAVMTSPHQQVRCQSGQMAVGDWLCLSCKTHNYSVSEACHRCHGPRGLKQGCGGGLGPTAIFRKTGEARAKQAAKRLNRDGPGDWTCVCGFHNFSNRYGCLKCNRAKPIRAMRSRFNVPSPRDWSCFACNTSNRVERDVCFGCQAAKPPTKAEVKKLRQQQLDEEAAAEDVEGEAQDGEEDAVEKLEREMLAGGDDQPQHQPEEGDENEGDRHEGEKQIQEQNSGTQQ